MTTFVILLGFGIPLFTYCALFWGKAIRAGVIFAVKQAKSIRRPAPLPDRVFVAGTAAIQVKETE